MYFEAGISLVSGAASFRAAGRPYIRNERRDCHGSDGVSASEQCRHLTPGIALRGFRPPRHNLQRYASLVQRLFLARSMLKIIERTSRSDRRRTSYSRTRRAEGRINESTGKSQLTIFCINRL